MAEERTRLVHCRQYDEQRNEQHKSYGETREEICWAEQEAGDRVGEPFEYTIPV